MNFNLCFLKDRNTGQTIAVNPLLVRLVVQDGNFAEILFDAESRVPVEGTVADVADALRKAVWCGSGSV
jgi:hypothetical protein